MRILATSTLLIPMLCLAQRPQVSLRPDTNVLRIGEAVELVLRVDDPGGAVLPVVEWPFLRDTLSRHVEVLRDHGVDTTLAADGIGILLLERRITITSFDTGYWAVPPFRLLIGGKSMETPALLLEVRSVALDPEGRLRDIHDAIDLPFSLRYWVRDHAWWLAGLALLALLIWLAPLLRERLRRRQEPFAAAMTTEPVLHERVLAGLRALEAERLWQQGEHKAYQSRLTDLLRGYIEERYKVPALERTTDELMRELRVSPLTRDQWGSLDNLLRLADLVKFAKGVPTPAENERAMAVALRFVSDTADHRTPSPHVPGAVEKEPTTHAH